jgi:phosphoglycerate dehydrogenase-like enzyme
MKKKALYLLSPGACHDIYGPEERAQLAELVDLMGPVPSAEKPVADDAALREVQILFGGWGSPAMDAAFLARTPKLEAVFYGAGSIRGITPTEFWDRNIPITSSYAANGYPVAEFTEAQIVMALKQVWQQVRAVQAVGKWKRTPVLGAYHSTVGIISLGMIGRLLAKRLQTHDLTVLAYDPFLSQAQADALGLGVRMVPLGELFATSDVVSLHAPNLPATKGLVSRALLASLKHGATFINTARGAIVDEPALCEILAAREDLLAILDVTFPEPPAQGSPLYTLPNVVLSPHIAGSLGNECRRMGQIVVDECRRFVAGQPLQWRISREVAATMA